MLYEVITDDIAVRLCAISLNSPALLKKSLFSIVITSYSIHYTKLYEVVDDKKKLVGIISRADILKAVLRKLR